MTYIWTKILFLKIPLYWLKARLVLGKTWCSIFLRYMIIYSTQPRFDLLRNIQEEYMKHIGSCTYSYRRQLNNPNRDRMKYTIVWKPSVVIWYHRISYWRNIMSSAVFLSVNFGNILWQTSSSKNSLSQQLINVKAKFEFSSLVSIATTILTC